MLWTSGLLFQKKGAYFPRLNVFQAVIILEVIRLLQHQQWNKINDNTKMV